MKKNSLESFDDTQLGQVLKSNLVRHSAPDSLRQSIIARIASLEAGPAKETKRDRSISSKLFSVSFWPKWTSIGASFAFGLVAGIASIFYLQQGQTEERLRDAIYSSHVRSLMQGHTYDVASSDNHTVKPWFNGKVDFAPRVVDLADSGYALLGGRLDYLQEHNAAALVYQRRQHLINLFVMKTAQDNSVPQTFVRHGVNGVSWRDDGLQFYAVSDLAAEELKTFVALIRGRNPEAL